MLCNKCIQYEICVWYTTAIPPITVNKTETFSHLDDVSIEEKLDMLQVWLDPLTLGLKFC